MQIARIAVAHLREGVSEQARAVENVGVFSEEAEDQSRHEVVHFMTAISGAPSWVVLEQLHIEPVQAAGGPNVKRVLADLLDRGNACQWQEKAKVVGELRVVTGDRLTAFQLFSLQRFTIGGEYVLGLGPRSSRAGFERRQRLSDLAGLTHRQMDIAGLQHAAQIGLVGCSRTQALEGGLLVTKGLQEGIRELDPIKGLAG